MNVTNFNVSGSQMSFGAFRRTVQQDGGPSTQAGRFYIIGEFRVVIFKPGSGSGNRPVHTPYHSIWSHSLGCAGPSDRAAFGNTVAR
jgi:hypothetical protein